MARRFLQDSDYSDQIRDEIRNLLDDSDDSRLLRQAEHKTIAQMRNWLTSRYDCDKIFAPVIEGEPDTRDAFIVMIAIDITLYHLWSKERSKIPQIRSDRYQDALDWLKSVGNGETIADLPAKPQDDMTGGVQIYSLYKPNNNKY